jgi:hypothetical protein
MGLYPDPPVEHERKLERPVPHRVDGPPGMTGPTDRCVLSTFQAARHIVTRHGVVEAATVALWWNRAIRPTE